MVWSVRDFFVVSSRGGAAAAEPPYNSIRDCACPVTRESFGCPTAADEFRFDACSRTYERTEIRRRLGVNRRAKLTRPRPEAAAFQLVFARRKFSLS